MYNLRYHIASLVAVFLALSVGLLLGSMVAERGMITKQTASMVDSLEKRFDEISATNDQLSLQVERDKSFADAAVVPLITGKLTGKRVIVLAGVEGADSVKSVNDAVVQAGGTVANVSLLLPALGLDKTEPEGLAGYLQLRGTEIEKPGDALQRQVAEALAAEWRNGESGLTALLVSDGLLSIESASGTSTVDAVVLVGNAKAGADGFGLEMTRAMNKSGGIGLGADSAAIEGGLPLICSAQGISAVDHVTSAQGKVSLVWLLSGNASGYYGFGTGAQAFYPPLDS